VTSLSESRSELDAMIADIELTLVSIIQGVALTVLIETSREAIAELDWVMWPYVLSSLIIPLS
jgi:adenylosuccinate synthase